VAITEGTQPTPTHPTGTTTTTASFTPESGALLVALVAADGATTAATTASLSDSLSGSWTLLKRVNVASSVNNVGGTAEVWCRDSPGVSMTVTASGWASNGGNLTVRTLIGAKPAAQQPGATGASTTGASVPPTATLTPTQIGSRIYGACVDYTTNATLTANGNSTSIDQFNDATNGDTWATFKSSGDTASLTSTAYGYNDPGSSEFNVAAVEILAVDSIPYNPQRAIQARDPGETWWIQKDRRDANLVGSAANPLVAPLDSAWQADARYWHLYNDTAARDRRAYFTQRLYVSDPNLLAGVPADPLLVGAGVGGDMWRRYNLPDYADRREVPQQRAYVSNPTLLSSALLENGLLGSADDLRRHYLQPALDTDRREVPQQRLYVSDPLLLTTALLENELLGGGDTAKRYLTAAYWDRREVPQQRPYVSDPSLLGTALLENELLGGADTARHYLAAAYYDRREVPQQRPYISDPSFYPTTAPTDPLTLAWGVEGHYWLMYNQPAMYTDRREVPQQRAYVSDPTMLLTALLENELLGGADDLKRHYLVAAWYDRREVPQMPARLDITPFQTFPADPLLVGGGVGGDRWRRYQTAVTNYDRRETAWQPPRWTVYTSGLTSLAGTLTLTAAAARLASSSTSGRLGPSTTAGRIIPTTKG
jgi:hypothetical protein